MCPGLGPGLWHPGVALAWGRGRGGCLLGVEQCVAVPCTHPLGERGWEHRAGIAQASLWAWGIACVPLPPPGPGTSAALPGAAGVSLCSGGPWIVPRRMLGSVLPWPRHGDSSLPCEPGCGRGYQSPAPVGQLRLGSWSPSLPSPCTLVGHGSAFSGRPAPQPRAAQRPRRVGAGAAAQHHPHAAHLRLWLLMSPPTGTCSTGGMKLICFPRVYWCQTCRFRAHSPLRAGSLLAPPFHGPCPLLSLLAVLALAAESPPCHSPPAPAQPVLCPLIFCGFLIVGSVFPPMPVQVLEVELPAHLLTGLPALLPSLQPFSRRSLLHPLQEHTGSSGSARGCTLPRAAHPAPVSPELGLLIPHRCVVPVLAQCSPACSWGLQRAGPTEGQS